MNYTLRHDAIELRSRLDAGLIAHHHGDFDRAIAEYRAVLALTPDNATALNLLGTALLQKGAAEESVGWLERASRAQRKNPQILANLAQAYIAIGRHDDAIAAFRKACRLEPREMQFQLGVATTLALQGRFNEAQALLERLTTRFPNAALVWFNLGNVMRDQARADDAIENYNKALELDPGLADARNNLGSVLHSMQRFAEAAAHYRACLELAPDYSVARYNLASVVIDLGRFGEAEAICREIVAAEPQSPRAHSFLAAALGHQGRMLEALHYSREAARLAPADASIAESCGAALMETGFMSEGLRMLSRALALDADSAAVHQLLGTALLAAGRLHDGWVEYGWRPAAIRFREKYPALSLTRSLPQDLRGKHVCVLREQGLGDEIFFLRYAPLLAARGAHMTYRASNKIASILARVSCIAAIIEEMSPLPPADANIMVGDLPHALGEMAAGPVRAPPAERDTALADFPHHSSIFWPEVPPTLRLEPLSARISQVRTQLAALGPPPYIGVTWRAGTPPEEQTSESWLLYKNVGLPGLAAAMKDVPGSVLALQRKPRSGEIDAFCSALGRPVHDLTYLNEDLEGMLALLGLIDEYVGVSNTNMHLRAAVGRTARVLVPMPAEWRWMQCGRSSPWFPGFSIYRQSLRGDWSNALAALNRDLAPATRLAASQSTP